MVDCTFTEEEEEESLSENIRPRVLDSWCCADRTQKCYQKNKTEETEGDED